MSEGEPITDQQASSPANGLLVLAGRRVAAAEGRTRTVYAPADGAAIAEVAEAGREDVARAVAEAVRAQPTWAARPPRERGDVISRWADLVDRNAEELARLEATNTGRPIAETRGDIAGAARTMRYCAGAADIFSGSTLPVDAEGLLITLREPIGVCALITAWNAPLYLAVLKAAPALVTGNAAVIKPSELTPLTTLRLADLASEAGIPEGCLSVLTGSGPDVGGPLVEHPRVGRVSFTGSTGVGREIARAAAGGFKRVTLELGGKSAALVFPDADLEKVGIEAPGAAFEMAGQDCCARSRLIVHESVKDEVVERYVETVSKLRVGPPLEEGTQVGPLISAAHRDRVHGFVERGCEAGATVLVGGEAPGGELAAGAYYLPTVLGGVGSAMEVAQAEIFGPVVAVMTFASESEAIALANDTEFGLSGSIWTTDVGRALRVAAGVRSGVLAVNSNTSVYPQAPFGGVGQSGLGRESGVAALEACTEVKTLFISAEASGAFDRS